MADYVDDYDLIHAQMEHFHHENAPRSFCYNYSRNIMDDSLLLPSYQFLDKFRDKFDFFRLDLSNSIHSMLKFLSLWLGLKPEFLAIVRYKKHWSEDYLMVLDLDSIGLSNEFFRTGLTLIPSSGDCFYLHFRGYWFNAITASQLAWAKDFFYAYNSEKRIYEWDPKHIIYAINHNLPVLGEYANPEFYPSIGYIYDQVQGVQNEAMDEFLNKIGEKKVRLRGDKLSRLSPSHPWIFL